MAAEQIIQVISQFPPPPQSGVDDEVQFNLKSDAFVAHQATNYTPEVNEWADQANLVALQVNDNAVSADEDAIAAGISEVNAKASEEAAEAAKNYLEASAISFKNIFCDGEVGRINQSTFDGNWGGISNGEYGYDMWQKVDASTISQTVEAGNFYPNTEYILSGNNVTTIQITSPSSGDWAVSIPNDASFAQLEKGSVATAFEKLDYGTDLLRVQRYYQFYPALSVNGRPGGAEGNNYSSYLLPVTLREVPSVSYGSLGGNVDSYYNVIKTIDTIGYELVPTNNLYACGINDIAIDARL